MNILIFCLLFLCGSISAACKGDWSGIGAIAEFIFVIVMTGLLVFYPVATILIIIGLMVVAVVFD